MHFPRVCALLDPFSLHRPAAVNFDNVMQVLLGTESPALGKLNVHSKVASEFISRSSSMAVRPGQYFLSGFLMKKGGSKGGRRNWTKVVFSFDVCDPRCGPSLFRACQRWHVLNGHTIQYFKNPKDTTPKGEFSVLRAVAAPVLDSKYEYCFEVRELAAFGPGCVAPAYGCVCFGHQIKIAGGEVRYFRADNPAELDEWLSTIRRAAIMPVGAAGTVLVPTGSPASANSTPVSRDDSETKSVHSLRSLVLLSVGRCHGSACVRS